MLTAMSSKLLQGQRVVQLSTSVSTASVLVLTQLVALLVGLVGHALAGTAVL